MFNITKFGKNLIIKNKVGKQSTTTDKQEFVALVDTFDFLFQRSISIENEINISLEKYDSLFFMLIENLFYAKYKEWETELIMWYVYDRLDDDGNLLPLLFIDETTEEEMEIKIENPSELYNFIKKLSKKIKN